LNTVELTIFHCGPAFFVDCKENEGILSEPARRPFSHKAGSVFFALEIALYCPDQVGSTVDA
jgi:hypothetical protein